MPIFFNLHVRVWNKCVYYLCIPHSKNPISCNSFFIFETVSSETLFKGGLGSPKSIPIAFEMALALSGKLEPIKITASFNNGL